MPAASPSHMSMAIRDPKNRERQNPWQPARTKMNCSKSIRTPPAPPAPSTARWPSADYACLTAPPHPLPHLLLCWRCAPPPPSTVPNPYLGDAAASSSAVRPHAAESCDHTGPMRQNENVARQNMAGNGGFEIRPDKSNTTRPECEHESSPRRARVAFSLPALAQVKPSERDLSPKLAACRTRTETVRAATPVL
jgi:hypothetical protein